MRMSEGAVIPVHIKWLRPLGAIGALLGLALTGASILICLNMLLPLYIRLWRKAPIVETVYPAFGVPAGIVMGIVLSLSGLYVLIFRRPLTSQSPTWLGIVERLFKVGMLLLVLLGPLLAIGTTFTLKTMDYETCSQLRISGSGWQVFWVNNENYCFRPDRYIKDNWPCKNTDGKTYCFRADGL